MDLDSVDPISFGRSLEGLGLNILAIDVPRLTRFLEEVFNMRSYQVTQDFSILVYVNQIFQIHADHTYHSHPLPQLISETGMRGGGIEIRLYETDPDDATMRAKHHEHNSTILQPPTNKPHGLRECVILCENGYAWIPSRCLSEDEIHTAK